MRSLIFEELLLSEVASDDEVVEALKDAGIDVPDDGPLAVPSCSPGAGRPAPGQTQ